MSRVYILLLILIFICCDTESNVEENFNNYFIKYYGGDGNQFGRDLIILPDGYLVLGTTRPNDNSSSLLLVRTDELGNEINQKIFGGSSSEANALAIETSGNYLVAATHTVSSEDTDILLMRLSPNLELLDSLSFGFPNEIEEAKSITITSQGDIIVVGRTTNVLVTKPGYNATTDLEDIYSVRVDASFTPITAPDWRSVTGFPGRDRGVNLLEKSDGTFLYFGTTNRPPSDPQKDLFNMFVYPAGQDGEPLSVTQLQLFGTLANEQGEQMIQTSEGGFTMLGSSSTAGENDLFLARIRSNNDFLSSGTINNERNLIASSILESNSGGFLVLGSEISNNTGNIYLVKLTISGAVLWETTFGGVDDDRGAKILELEDGSIVFVGTVELETQSKISLFKTNREGRLAP